MQAFLGADCGLEGHGLLRLLLEPSVESTLCCAVACEDGRIAWCHDATKLIDGFDCLAVVRIDVAWLSLSKGLKL